MDILRLIEEVEYFYESITTIYANKKFYLYKKNNMWTILREDAKTVIKETKNSIDVFNFMSINNIDLDKTEKLLLHCICTRYIWHKRKIEKIMKICSKEVLDKAESEFVEFQKGLGKIVKKTVNAPKLELIKGGECLTELE